MEPRSRLLQFDVVAGLTTAAVVIPKAMAYATIAGLPVETGLYTALIPLVVYAVLGSSRPLSVTTTSTLAILVAGEIAELAPGASQAQAATIATSLALLVGAMLIAASVLRLGFLANFISAPVLTGFKAGIGLVIIVDQLPKLIGVHIDATRLLPRIVAVGEHLPQASVATLILGLTLFAIVLVLEHLAPRAPAPLIAVALGIAACWFLKLDRMGVAQVGAIHAGLPAFALPDLSLAGRLWPGALGISLMSFVETAAAGRSFVRPGEPMPTPNRELLAIGAANAVGSLFQVMPAGGGTSQTAVNRAAGARTKVAGLVTAAAVAATLLFLSPVVSLMPQTALAAVVIATTLPLVDPADFLAIRRVRSREFWWAVAAAAGVVSLGTLRGILVAVALSMFVLFYQANHPPVYVVGRRRSTGTFEPMSLEDEEVKAVPGLLMLRTEGRLHFANAHYVGDRAWLIILEAHPKAIALDLSAVPDIEYTALATLVEAVSKLAETGTLVWLVAATPFLLQVLNRTPLAKLRTFATLEQAVSAYEGERK